MNNVNLGVGTLYVKNEDGTFKELGAVNGIETLDINDYVPAPEEIEMFKAVTGQQTMTFKLEVPKKKVICRKRKGKRYIPYQRLVSQSLYEYLGIGK